MAGEKYVVAASDNSLQISVRNTLNPNGYMFLGNCSDAISLLRLVRSYHPDFIVVEIVTQQSDLRKTLETIDGEMLCASILLGDYKDIGTYAILEKSNAISYCPKPVNRDILLHTVELANLNYRRISGIGSKLREMTDNYETRKQVERAKWILMERYKISEKEAYERMRKKSMNGRMSMKIIAESIIYTHEVTEKG